MPLEELDAVVAKGAAQLVDTNILVRYFAQDDALQSPFALRIFIDEPELFVMKTVLLEFFWVLTQAEKFHFPAE
ncbi:hypothetical protein GO003_012020 [Methylicorpusculum oleiharenae]|uniref:hypothetical protein n=1 Tax=Methylicorpusculum oleiharenae TaxID=1338687 RepID=UPI0013598935|nr:hypothetical protein [Methylicorpusculum oleiharenae]MCD2451119.1 hypothetical protein [Methylicorpusculum oleiharenae]